MPTRTAWRPTRRGRTARAHRGRGRRCWPACCGAAGAAGGWPYGTLDRKVCILTYVAKAHRATPSRCARASPVRRSTTWSAARSSGAGAGGPGGEPGGHRRGGAGAGRRVAALAAPPRAARYEVERAARQYQAVEPENRLVARELERRWEESLKAQRQLEEEYERWQRTAPGRLSTADEEAIRSLAADLPTVWRAATTTAAERQRAARLLLDGVKVTVNKTSEHVAVELRWAGGLVRRHTLSRPVKRYDLQSDYPLLVERLQRLCAERLSSAAIAERLNAEGFRPPKRTDHFTGSIVQRLTSRLGLTRRQRHGSAVGLSRDEYRPAGLARRLGISRDTVKRWVRVGWLTVRRDADGHHVIWADAAELRRLGELYRLPRTWATKERLEELKQPKPRPER